MPAGYERDLDRTADHCDQCAVRGAEVIVHCAGSSKGDEQKTRTLVSAA